MGANFHAPKSGYQSQKCFVLPLVVESFQIKGR